MAIPSAHDSGTFNLDETDFDTQSGSDCTSYSPIFASAPVLVERWSEAQSIGYTRQLGDGVRYFNVRVAYTGTAQRGWRIVHTQFSNDPPQTDMATIASPPGRRHTPTEVVIVDIQHLCYDSSPTDSRGVRLDLNHVAHVTFRLRLCQPGARSVSDQLFPAVGRSPRSGCISPNSSTA